VVDGARGDGHLGVLVVGGLVQVLSHVVGVHQEVGGDAGGRQEQQQQQPEAAASSRGRHLGVSFPFRSRNCFCWVLRRCRISHSGKGLYNKKRDWFLWLKRDLFLKLKTILFILRNPGFLGDGDHCFLSLAKKSISFFFITEIQNILLLSIADLKISLNLEWFCRISSFAQ